MITTQEIARRVGGRLYGSGEIEIEGVAALDRAQPRQITFIRDTARIGAWRESRASAALASHEVSAECLESGKVLIGVEDVDSALIEVLHLFAPAVDRPEPGVDETAVVGAGVELGKRVAVGAGCRIGPRVRIGGGTILHPGVTVMAGVTIGSDCELYPGVVIREGCVLCDRVMIHPNAVIGADGFGYHCASDGGGLVKVPHIGIVRLGDDVEIGAGTCVDRAKFGATEVGEGTKIDNLCQIGHNCRIGRGCVFSGQVGLAGSVVVEDGVVMGGKVAVRDHVRIGAGVKLAACSAVMDDIPAGATWAGYPAQDSRVALREHAAIRKLPELVRNIQRQRKADRAERDPQPR